MRSLRLVQQLFFLALPVFSGAVYYIDDTNSTIKYSGSWKVFTDKVAFNKTFTYTECDKSALSNCRMDLPFTGSGITVYIIRSYDANVTVALDGGQPTAMPFVKDVVNPYNFTLFSARSLPFALHTFTVVLQSFTPGSYSDFEFDYAEVNDTDPNPLSPAATASSSASRSAGPSGVASQSTNSKSANRTGAAVGGAIGGLAFISVVVALFLCWRRTRERVETEPDPMSTGKHHPDVFRNENVGSRTIAQPALTYTPPRTPSPTTSRNVTVDRNTGPPLQALHSPAVTTSNSDDLSPLSWAAQTASLSPSTTSPTTAHNSLLSAVWDSQQPAAPPVPAAPSLSDVPEVPASTAPPPTSPPSSHPGNILSSEQIAFVHGLQSLNVPVAEIAALMESMRTAQIASRDNDYHTSRPVSQPFNHSTLELTHVTQGLVTRHHKEALS